jgi:hypothetical protein
MLTLSIGIEAVGAGAASDRDSGSLNDAALVTQHFLNI